MEDKDSYAIITPETIQFLYKEHGAVFEALYEFDSSDEDFYWRVQLHNRQAHANFRSCLDTPIWEAIETALSDFERQSGISVRRREEGLCLGSGIDAWKGRLESVPFTVRYDDKGWGVYATITTEAHALRFDEAMLMIKEKVGA